MARVRCSSQHVAPLREVLERASLASPAWLKYGETDWAPTDRAAIETHFELIQSLEMLTPNLSIKQKDVLEIFTSISQSADVPWTSSLKEEEKADWNQTMTRRLRLMLRHAQQAKIKRTAWYVAAKLANEDKDAKDEENGQPETAYTYGFDYDLKQA